MNASEPVETSKDPRSLQRGMPRLREGILLALVVILIATNAFFLLHSTAQDRMRGLISSAALAFGAQWIAEQVIEGTVENRAKRLAAERTAPLVAERDSLSKEKRSLVTRNEKLDLDNRNLEAKHAALDKSHKELEGRHAQLSRTSARQREVATRVSARVASRASQVAVRSAGSAIPKAVPLAGIPVIVAMTALDIYDTCAMLKEINELNESIEAGRIDERRVCGLRVPSAEELRSGLIP